MRYGKVILLKTALKLKVLGYPYQTAGSPEVPFSSNPDMPWASQQSKFYDYNVDSPFCTKCKSKNTERFKDGSCVCKECNTRVSDSNFKTDGAPNGRNTGLLNLSGGSSQYHADQPSPDSGSGSASTTWGKGDRS